VAVAFTLRSGNDVHGGLRLKCGTLPGLSHGLVCANVIKGLLARCVGTCIVHRKVGFGRQRAEVCLFAGGSRFQADELLMSCLKHGQDTPPFGSGGEPPSQR